MYFSKFLMCTIVAIMISQTASCAAIGKIKGSIAGTVYNNGRPTMGQVQLLDPKTKGSIKTQPVNNSGHFIIQDVPPGEWVLAFLGPASNPIGNLKYVKVLPGRPLTDLVYEITEEDPLVADLLERVAAQSGEKGE